MKHLYYVKHGESTVNANKVRGARFNALLTELGRQRAQEAERLAESRRGIILR